MAINLISTRSLEDNISMEYAKKRTDIEEIARQIVDSAITVHRELGPGLLESTYQVCLAYELRKRGMKVETEVNQPVRYDGHLIDAGYRLDMLIEGSVIVENKVVDSLSPVHLAQLLTYLRLRECTLGFLLNWNVRLMKNGIRRVVNHHDEVTAPKEIP